MIIIIKYIISDIQNRNIIIIAQNFIKGIYFSKKFSCIWQKEKKIYIKKKKKDNLWNDLITKTINFNIGKVENYKLNLWFKL